MNGDRIVGADDCVNDADTDGVSVFLIAECEERSSALHKVRGDLPIPREAPVVITTFCLGVTTVLPECVPKGKVKMFACMSVSG
jgi:hypothetical protein